MPLYEFICNNCGRESSDILPFSKSNSIKKCLSCGAFMMRKISIGVHVDVFPAEGIHLEHVSADGKTFYSKQEMRQFENEHDVTIGMLH